MIAEPDVALTDWVLAVESSWLAAWLYRWGIRRTALLRGFVAFFAGVGAAALLGGVSHAFLTDPATLPHRIVWTATLLAIGLAASASWVISAQLLFSPSAAGRIAVLASLLFSAYAAAVLFVSQAFLLAMIYYLPAAIFPLVALAAAYRRRPSNELAAGILGVTLTFAAAAIQQTGTGLHRFYFDHNALYHVIQALALLLIFVAARDLVTRKPEQEKLGC